MIRGVRTAGLAGLICAACVVLACGGRAQIRGEGGGGGGDGEPPSQADPDRPLDTCYAACAVVVDCPGDTWNDYSESECRDSCDDATDLARGAGCREEWGIYIACAFEEFECNSIDLSEACTDEAEDYVGCVGY